MKRLIAYLLSTVLLVAASRAEGWQPTQRVLFGDKDPIEGSCSRFPDTTVTVCVIEQVADGDNADLYETITRTGGAYWSAGLQITNLPDPEFDPYLTPDFSRGRVLLLYSRAANGASDLLLRSKRYVYCAWSPSSVVVSDGQNHWDASLTALSNGDLLVLETLEGYHGRAPATIRSIRSRDGGVTWEEPQNVLNELTDVSYPVAVEKSDHVLHLMFRDGNHGEFQQIGQAWSTDFGRTWIGHSVFEFDFRPTEFSFLGTFGGQHLLVLASLLVEGEWQAHRWASWNNGLSWDGPVRITELGSLATQDAEASLGCKGPIFTFCDADGFSSRTFVWAHGPGTCGRPHPIRSRRLRVAIPELPPSR